MLAVAHPWASASSYLSSQSVADSRCNPHATPRSSYSRRSLSCRFFLCRAALLCLVQSFCSATATRRHRHRGASYVFWARRLFGALHVSCPGGVREAPPGHQMGPPGGLRAPAEATLVVPRHPPDSCCAALACVAADGGTPCAAAPQTRHCRRHTCPQMRRVPVRPRQTGLVADRQPALCLRRRLASRIVVTFRSPTSRAGAF